MRTDADVAAMQCPVCRVPLSMSDRSGIEIDFCPQCRGVWLDRGELDKIIERSAPQPVRGVDRVEPDYARHGGQSQAGFGHGHYGKSHKKQKNWLSEIFD